MSGLLEALPSSEWKLVHEFKDKDDTPINCGRSDCTLGDYLLNKDGGIEFFAPACTTCEFTGNCADVFNADEPRFQPGAPEDFKRGAALVLTKLHPTIVEVIRNGRPDTAEMIDTYAAGSNPLQ